MIDLREGCILLFATCLSFIAYFVFYMIYKLAFPTIISYPWLLPKDRSLRRDKERTVILAGSYNPPHKGHLAMLSYLSTRYGQVIAVIGMNPKKSYAVSPARRADLLQIMIDRCIFSTGVNPGNSGKNIRVEIVSGYVWRFAMKNRAKILYRGIRSWEKDGVDESKLHKQNLYGPMLLGPLKWPLPTYYLEGVPEYRHVSSTLIRDLCEKNLKQSGTKVHGYQFLNEFIPDSMTAEVAAVYGPSNS